MKIQKLIEEQRKSFDEKFSEYIKTVSIGQYDKEGVNVGFLSAKDVIFKWHTDVLRKLIEALGSELIGHDTAVMWAQSDNALRARQRIKLKEILQNIK